MTSFLIQDQKIDLPVEVRVASAASAAFSVPAVAAQRVIEYSGLEIAEYLPGKAICTLAFIDYQDSDLGRYHEFGVVFLVRRHTAGPTTALGRSGEVVRGRVGAFVHRLPVDQGFTLEAGRTIWGFPKELAEIDITSRGSYRTCTLRFEGTTVIDLTVRSGVMLPRRAGVSPGVNAYTFLDGTLRCTPWQITPIGVRTMPSGAHLVLGNHLIADELRLLGLPHRALASTTIDQLSMSFDAAQDCGRP